MAGRLMVNFPPPPSYQGFVSSAYYFLGVHIDEICYQNHGLLIGGYAMSRFGRTCKGSEAAFFSVQGC
jgi:hypothetical protein